METGGEEIILNGPAIALGVSRIAVISNERPREAHGGTFYFAPGAASIVFEPEEEDVLGNENPNVADQLRVPAGQLGGGRWTTGSAGGAQMAPSKPVLSGGNNWTPPAEGKPGSETGLTHEQRQLLRQKNAQAVAIIARYGDKGEIFDTPESILNGPLKSGWGANLGWEPFTTKWDMRHQYKGFGDGDIALMESTRRNVARASVLLAQAGKLSKSQVTALQLRGMGVLADATLALALALAPYDSAASLAARSLLGAPAAVIDTGVAKMLGSVIKEPETPPVVSQIRLGRRVPAGEEGAGLFEIYPLEKYSLLYRYDGRSPETIFSQGFTARGRSLDLLAHVEDNKNPPSAFIPTSNIYWLPDKEEGPKYMYAMAPRNGIDGIDVNAVLGDKSRYPDENEIAVPFRIRPEDIRAAAAPETEIFFLNPKWKP